MKKNETALQNQTRVYVFFWILLLTFYSSLSFAHPEDELCPPGEAPSAFCLALNASVETPTSPEPEVILPRWQIWGEYIKLGYLHIIPKGLDHILFILGLFFASTRIRPLLLQITAFTLAHTVTLALATLGLIKIPAMIIEPLIALSIAYVAVENIILKSRKTSTWRPAIVFGFGLLHGLGFASVLMNLGLPQSGFLSGLIAFNIGVELGQLSIIALLSLLLYRFIQKSWYPAKISIPSSIIIALIGVYWTVERLLQAFSTTA